MTYEKGLMEAQEDANMINLIKCNLLDYAECSNSKTILDK